MAHKVYALFFVERACARDVVAVHRDFAQVMSERGHFQRRAVMLRQMKELCYFVRYACDARSVRVPIAFKLVRRRAQSREHLAGCALARCEIKFEHKLKLAISYQPS